MTPSPTQLATAVTAKLVALGDTEPAVAESLKAAGITGRRWSATNCPVGRYLLGQADLGLDRAYVGATYVTVTTEGGALVEDLAVPGPVSSFITAFDLGAYDALAAGEVQGWQEETEGAGRGEVR